MTMAFAQPQTAANTAALALTQLQLQQAVQLAGANKDLIPAILQALATNRLSWETHVNGPKR